METELQQTHLTTLDVYDQDRAITFPVRFDRGFSVEKTNLLSRMVEVWGEVPIALIQHLDIRHSQYAYIGLKDFTMYPLLRPGSFIQIDQRVNKIQAFLHGERSTTGPFISSNYVTDTRVRGASCTEIS